MNRIILTASLLAIVSLAATSSVLADHNSYRRDLESSQLGLNHEYKAKREANKYAYHRNRDALYAARRQANRIDCRDTRALRVRAINRDLSALSREYHLSNREIATWYRNERNALRTSYEVAMRTARRAAARPFVVETVASHPVGCECKVCIPVVEPVVVDRPVLDRRFLDYARPTRPLPTYAHPADCDCHICEPPTPVFETCPNNRRYYEGSGRFNDGRGFRNYDQGHDFDPGYSPTSYHRKPNAVDWASLILNAIR